MMQAGAVPRQTNFTLLTNLADLSAETILQKANRTGRKNKGHFP